MTIEGRIERENSLNNRRQTIRKIGVSNLNNVLVPFDWEQTYRNLSSSNSKDKDPKKDNTKKK